MRLIRHLRRSVQAQLLVALILFGSVVTLGIWAIEVSLAWKTEMDRLENVVDRVGQSRTPSLSQALWINSEMMLQSQLDSITHESDIAGARILVDGQTMWEAGDVRRDLPEALRTFPLTYEYRGETRMLGNLEVRLDLAASRAMLRKESLRLLLGEAATMSLIALFIYLVVHYMISSHLRQVAGYLRKFDPAVEPVPLRLSRPWSGGGRDGDELDQLVHETNTLARSLSAAYREMHGALRQTEKYFNAFSENVPGAVSVSDAEGRLLFANPHYYAMVGLRPEQVLARPIEECMSAEAARRIKNQNELVLELQCEQDFEDKIGWEPEARHYLTRRFPIASETGDTLVGAVSMDITDRTHHEEQRREFADQQADHQKLESLQVMAGAIAHNFNNHLMSVLGNLEFLETEIAPHSEMWEPLEYAQKSARMAADISQEMLTYVGQGDHGRRTVHLGPLCEDILGRLGPQILGGVPLRKMLSMPGPRVRIDATQIERLLHNLLLNAVEASTETEASVSISCGEMQCEVQYLNVTYFHPTLAAGSYAWIEVADHGCGMDEETRAKMFDPFFSTKFTGRGLGLATVHGVLQSHQGAVTVHTQPSEGTRIRVLFPTLPDGADQASNTPQRTQARRDKSGTVLLIEDDDSIGRLCRQLLQRVGYQVMLAHTGEEGIRRFQSQHDVIDVVVLDLMLPAADGATVFEALRKESLDVAIIVSSGYSPTEVSRQLKGGTPDAILAKPYPPRDLVDKVDEVMKQRKRDA